MPLRPALFSQLETSPAQTANHDVVAHDRELKEAPPISKKREQDF
jgi:hypothetical protein